MVALSSLSPCWAALAGADAAPRTLDTNVWVCSLGSKVCQGGRQVWAAAQPQRRELPSHPVHGRGWSGVAARAWHPSGHAATAQLLGTPESAPHLGGCGEGLWVSLKKRLPKCEAHPSWGHFSHGQRRQLPFGRQLCQGCLPQPGEPPCRIAGLRGTGVCRTRRGEERRVSPKPPSRPLSLALAFRRADTGPFGDLLGRVPADSAFPFPFPFQGCIPARTGKQPRKNPGMAPLSIPGAFISEGVRGPAQKRSQGRRFAWSPEPGSSSRTLRSHDGSSVASGG